ncbi:MAG: hypothetical protein OXF79_00575 [Chloroflexi bacterium]|nr:hypothetical protein [Chloroflexota bacterium]
MTQQNVETLRTMLDAINQDPALQSEMRQWMLQFIRKDDDLRQELRKEILTEELLQLPIRLTQFQQAVGERLDKLDNDVTEIKDGQARISGQTSHLMGNAYETSAIEQSRRRIRRLLGMEKATVVHASRRPSDDFENEVLLPAIRQGRISRQQADQLEDADVIIRCEDPDGSLVYAVAEISMTVQNHDRARASERAHILNLATGLRTLAYTVGQQEAPSSKQDRDVTFVPYTPVQRI